MERKNVFVVGCNGKMGRIVCKLIKASSDLAPRAGLDSDLQGEDVTSNTWCLYCTCVSADCLNGTDVIIDFSHPDATMSILPFAIKLRIPMVIATTGFDSEQEQRIEEAAAVIPIFKSANMGLCTKRFIEVVKYAARVFLAPYEISIHEIHHSAKKDAPSGTAKMLFDAVNEGRDGTLVYHFDSNDKKGANEVWVSSERVGSFRGEHIVTMAGANDVLQLRHSIADRTVFAEGALEAARYIMQQTEPRIYTMDDLFNE